jgi:LPXTG-site transpeptidase (sortase) family protein
MGKRAERAFWLIAVICLGVYSLSLAETVFYQRYLEWQFTESLPPPLPPPLLLPPPPPVAATVATVPGQTIGRLEIPSIKLAAMVAEGVDNRTLRRSVGHIPGTAMPGSPGNVGLSGHRDTFFRHLGQLNKDDVIWITAAGKTFYYAVESMGIVDPDEAIVLRDVGRPTLTLVTCYPFYYVGPAPKRFIVHARLILS